MQRRHERGAKQKRNAVTTTDETGTGKITKKINNKANYMTEYKSDSTKKRQRESNDEMKKDQSREVIL